MKQIYSVMSIGILQFDIERENDKFKAAQNGPLWESIYELYKEKIRSSDEFLQREEVISILDDIIRENKL